ncbi:MAG: hypothetical protein F6K32_26940 [Desertifilum sp. SIO1I2]|nr:hypothetical protein [Desertifilum sp. SIO1I2]
MRLLTLADFKLRETTSLDSLVPACVQQQFKLLVKQMLMGLPVEPILNNYPQFRQWILELQELSPSLFVPRKKLSVDLPLTARLELNSSSPSSFKVIEVRTNVGLFKGKERLFEWGIRNPILSYSDRVKLWVATERFQLKPDEMQLTVLALHPTKAAQKVVFSWNHKQHKRTRNWLINKITERENQLAQAAMAIPKTDRDTDKLVSLADDIARAIAIANSLDEIDEIPL